MELKLIFDPNSRRPRLLLGNKEITTFKLQFESIESGANELAAVCVIPTQRGNVLYVPLGGLQGELSCEIHQAGADELLALKGS